MKRPRASTILALMALTSSTPSITGSEVDNSNDNASSNRSQRTNTNLIVKLSASPSEAAPQIPLIGIGVSNLPHHRIPFLLATAMDSKQPAADGSVGARYQLVDTSRNPALKVLVGRSLGRLLTNDSTASSTADKGEDYHVIIKIWHTHFGYDPTIASVHDSLVDILPGGLFSAESSVDPSSWKKDPRVKIHAVLEYPRCYDASFASKYYEHYQTLPNFPIKNCHEEEKTSLKSSSSHPTAYDSNSMEDKLEWKRSYRALEELYQRQILESIGVANFGPTDMSALYEYASVGPHVYMGTLHNLIEEDGMVENMAKRGVHYICYDAVSTILVGRQKAVSAYGKLERIGEHHGEVDSDGYSAVQMVLGWLIQRGVGIVAGTTESKHLVENSPQVLSRMPKLSLREKIVMEMVMQALVSGEYIEEEQETERMKNRDKGSNGVGGGGSMEEGAGVAASFFNSLQRNVRIFRVHPATGRQIPLSSIISPGKTGRMMVDANDVLIAYDGHGGAVKKFLVETDEGGGVDFII